MSQKQGIRFMNVKITEKLGLDWKWQPVLMKTDLPVDLNTTRISIFIDDEEVVTDLFRIGDRIYASFPMELKPFSTRLITTGPRKEIKRVLSCKRSDDYHIIEWLERTIKIPASGFYEKDQVPAFLKSLTFRGKEYIRSGSFLHPFNEPVRIDTEVIFMGYQLCLIKIDYINNDDLLYSTEISINGQFPEININEKLNGTEGIGNRILFTPKFTGARAKLHTPSLNNIKKDFWERVEFSPQEQKDVALKLQPFYAWGLNAGSYLAASTENSILNIVPVHASKWRNGSEMQLTARFAHKNLEVETKGLNCEGHWLISVIEKDKDYKEINPVKFTGGYNNYYYQIDKELKGTYYAERLMATHSGQSISKLLDDITLDFNTNEMSSGVLINRLEMPLIGNKYKNDNFILGISAARGQTVQGIDMAGVFLLDNDKRTADKLAYNIREWFNTRIGLLFHLGYSSVHLECIALSRPLRDVAIDLDIICGSICPADRKWLFHALAYLTCIIGDEDYWPGKKNGFEMGNKNFHSDIYACIGVCACVLKGHSKSISWIDYAVTEFEKELESSIYPGGAWAEAPTYHLASLSHLFILATALKNSGYKNFFLQPELMETMLFLSYIQTPVDPRCGFSMIPSLGDTTSNILTQSWQALFAWVAKNTYSEHPKFSALMMRAWVDGGSMRLPFSYNSGLKLAIAMVDPDLPVAKSREYKSRHFSGFGVIMNKQSDNYLSGYIALKVGEINNHYDHDEGTFIWYSNEVPILIDYGTQYNPGVDQSFWHNRISIDHKSDWCRGEVQEFITEEEYDYVKMHVNINKVQEWPEYPDRDPEFNFRKLPEPYTIPAHSWTRKLVYLKEIESLLIIDEVGGNLPYDWNLHVLAEEVEENKDVVTFRCMQGICLDVHLLQKSMENIKLSSWEHRGLDETRIPIAWRDYSWMWEREITNMGERSRILRVDEKAPYRTVVLMSARKGIENPHEVLFDDSKSIIYIRTSSGISCKLQIEDGFHYSMQNGEKYD